MGFEPTRPFPATDLAGRRYHNGGNPIDSEILSEFETFCAVDLQLTKGTARGHADQIKRFRNWLGERSITQSVLREYLIQYNEKPCTYANRLKSLKVFCRDFLKTPELVESFRFPRFPFKSKTVPTKIELREFYSHIEKQRDKALFLFYASSGLRRREALTLDVDDVDFESRMIRPKPHNGQTKFTWVTFFNSETEQVLRDYLANRKYRRSRLFPIGREYEGHLWSEAREKTGLKITPKILRDWFCDEMGQLGVQDRYIDAFCGRVPKSVLARNYSDYSVAKLKEIYDKANLTILCV